MDVSDWLDDHAEGWVWYVKRLAGNDTLANGSHQSGFYIPRAVFFRLFPSLAAHTRDNADAWIDLTVSSHPDTSPDTGPDMQHDPRPVRVIWYNNKHRGGTRDEVRVTNLGGGTSALLDPESTGALAVFAFRGDQGQDAARCDVWVCRSEAEEDLVERDTGTVEPGRWTTWPPDGGLFAFMQTANRSDCRLAAHALPPEWLVKFPGGAEIIRKVKELRPETGLSVDKRLIRRRDCEFELFRALEEAVELPRAAAGFQTIDAFLAAAQTMLQRRKARSGKSLELHMREILLEEGFDENRDFTYQPKAGNNPDFLFPNEQAYLDPAFPRDQVQMLAVKTTFKDRWRQITEECADLPVRYLLTLQEGVSEPQFRLITNAGIRLVVPEKNLDKYARDIRPHLLTLAGFLALVRPAD